MITKTGTYMLLKMAGFEEDLANYMPDAQDPEYAYEAELDRIIGLMSNPRRNRAGKIYYGDMHDDLARAIRKEQGVPDVQGTGRLYYDDEGVEHTGDRHVAATGTQTIVSHGRMHSLLKNVAINAQTGALKHSTIYKPKNGVQKKQYLDWVEDKHTRPEDIVDFAAIAAQKDGDFRTVTAFPQELRRIREQIRKNPHAPVPGLPVKD